ncbi:hypothetical protein SteCoe_1742 [Stentor coeruleus]|uniref:Elongator complex protein 1 n=1 Tax=Stentor coeruleus TaxID=5963 RepID=A0A1R2D186_9CILI|nr:hypothetical protein SteCoe_1742 [Stentor coeruleus]
MENLWQVSQESWEVTGDFTCDSDKIYVLSSNTELKIIEGPAIVTHTLDISIDNLVEMTWLQIEEKLIFITTSSIISYEPSSKDCINEGEMTCRISSARWSPNQELLALFLENGSLFLQNTDLEVVKTIQTGLNHPASISWRNDSKFFQICGKYEDGYKVLTLDNKGNLLPSTVVSDKSGPVQSVCDMNSLLSSPKISWHSSLIAGIHNNKIILWEKNGLKHEEFNTLNTPIDLSFNTDGKILAVFTNQGLELYIKNNYKWYLKQFFSLCSKFSWGEDFLIIQGKKLEKIMLYTSFNINQDKVVVIDGLNIHLTDFSKGILPPPMSHAIYKISSPVKALWVGIDEIFIVNDKVIEIIKGHEKFVGTVDLICKIDDKIYASVMNKLYEILEKQLVLIEEYDRNIGKLVQYKQKPMVELDDGRVYVNEEMISKFPCFCPSFGVLELGKGPEIVGLASNTLYFGTKAWTSGCTSLLIQNSFLFFTKKNAPYDVLYIFHFSDLPWEKPLPDPSNEHFYSRSIEKTCLIVSQGTLALVLQHSRGNLEGISPRLLTLHQVRTLIHQQKYEESFKLLRKHKIDLNLLYDIDPDKFNIPLFISSIKKQEYFNLFLTSLKDTDSVNKYFHTQTRNFEGKTNKISEEFRKHLNPESHSLSILTTFAIKTPAEIDKALQWVQELKKNSPAKYHRAPHENSDEHGHKNHPEDAIKYLSWLVNPEKLYNVALGMYDLELTSDLAKYTQKDPKEYLPYLNSLKNLSEVQMKYQINMDLKNHSKALEELVQGGLEYRDQALSLIKTHKLYHKGLQLLQGKDVLLTVAESLTNSDYPLQAAALFEACEEYYKARDLYANCEEWELAVKMGKLINEDLTETWSHKCAELGRFESAAFLSQNSDDEHLLIKYWVQAGKYKQAAICCKTKEGKDLLKSTLKNYANDLIGDLDKNFKTWTEKKTRLEFVQQNKRLMPESNKILNDETASMYSMDSSMSKMTQFSKKQKKKNRKIRKTAAKEGSMYEEDYLVDLLVTLRPDIAYLEKVENLCIGLIVVGEILIALELFRKVEEVKNVTYKPISTLKQQEFVGKFFESFPEVTRNEENESRLKDMFEKSTFLADGLASHKLPNFSSKLQGFFKAFA